MKNSKKPMTLRDIANAQEKLKTETVQLKLLLKHLKRNPELNVVDWIDFNLAKKAEVKQNLKDIKLKVLNWQSRKMQNEINQLKEVTND